MKIEKWFSKRLISVFLSLALVFSLLPGGFSVVAEAADMYVTLHFNNSSWQWGTPTIQYWNGSPTVTDNDGEAVEIPNWGGATGTKLSADSATGDGWYKITLQGNVGGFQFLDLDNTSNTVSCYVSTIANYTGSAPKDLYFNTADSSWYLDSSYTTPMPVPEARYATIHFLNSANWETPVINTWNGVTVTGGDGSATATDWSNGFTKLTKETENYYSVTLQCSDAIAGIQIMNAGQADATKLELTAAQLAVINDNCKAETPTDVYVAYGEVYLSKDDIPTGSITVADNGYVVKGKSLELNTAATFSDGATSTDVTVSYSLKESVDGVTLSGNTLTVADTATATSVTLIATYNGFTKEVTIPVEAKEYTVNFYMFSQDIEMTPGVSDIYIFENGGARNTAVDLTGTYEDTDNNVTWVTGTLKVPYNSLGIIARDQAGSWSGGQDANQYYVIDENTDEVTLWYVYGKTPVTEKPVVVKTAQRYLYLEYENASLGDVIPQFYSWTTGYAATRVDFEVQGNGKYLIKVPVKSTCKKVDFVTVLDASGADWVKDGGDHSISFPLDQTVVCASMKAGEEPELSAPYNTGYEIQPKEGKISFYYRDDAALVDGTLANLAPKVEINGSEYAMTYVEAEKRFVYVMNGLTDGKYTYRYHVGEEYIVDKYNASSDDTYSYVEYYKLNATINAEVMNASFNYNENNVVKFTVSQADTDAKKFEVKKATIDVSSLGGSSTMAIEPELQAVTISVTSDTTLGTKTLPIVVTDQYGNEYTTSVNVNVVERVKASENDFDWEEACIYFMVTDRFFDGNATNNTASGENTYGTNEGLYHGGDFAGVTQKLDYLKDLGINTIWITPIVENIPGVTVTGEGGDDVPYNSAYHGYWASDFTKLNPTLGTADEFKALIDEAHKRGIRIMVDIVVNHAGYGTEDAFGDLIRTDAETVTGDDQLASLSGLPDFQTEDADVRAQLVKWQTAWIQNYDIDYFRVDTVKHVDGTTWAALKNSLTSVDASFKMIGEYAGAGYAANGGSLGTGQMDSDLDFDFNGMATSFVSGNLTAVEKFMTGRNAALNNTYLTGQFLGSHDEDGFKYNLINNNKLSEEEATAAALVAATLQITAKGQPVIYYGEEIGLTGANNYPYQTNRYDFDWSLTTDTNVTYQHYKKLLAIRKSYSTLFARADRSVVAIDDAKGYDIVKRTYNGESLYVAMNLKNESQTVALNGLEANATYKDVYSGTAYTADANGAINLVIPASSAGGTAILVKEVGTPAPPSTDTTPGTDTTPAPPSTDTTPGTDTTPAPPSTDTPPSAGTTTTTVKAKKITLPKTSRNMYVGEKITLKATVTPTNTTNKAVTYKSSNTSVATVDAKGKITAKKRGKAVITVKAKDGSGVYARCTIYVGYKITYKLNGGKNSTKNPTAHTSYANVKLSSPSRAGYIFKGWYTNKKFTAKSKITTISKTKKGAITLYAKWEKVKKPSKAKLKTVKSSKAGMLTVTTKKVSSVTGYEFKIATNKKFTKNVKTYTTKKLTTTFKSLKKGTTYYVKVRAYKLDSANKKVYGSYSSVKTIKVKK